MDMAAFATVTYNLTGDANPERLVAVRVTPAFFAVLGMQPLLGRTLAPSDEGPNTTPVVVVHEGLWRRRFGGDPGLVGRSISLNGVAHTIVGVVMLPDFRLRDAAFWVPASFTAEELANRGSFFSSCTPKRIR